MMNGMCDLVIFRLVKLLQGFKNIEVCDIMKRHTENKDTHVCIEMYGIACFLELIFSEGPSSW